VRRGAVVTGGTKGLGREITLEIARRGGAVLALYHADETAAREFDETIRSLGLRGRAVRHDIASETCDWDAIWTHEEIRDAEALVLVNNACAPFQPTPLHHLGWEDFARQIEVAVKGPWLGTRAALQPMVKAGRGVIVNVLTTALDGLPPKGFAAYATAKHALRGLTLALAGELSARGLRVFSVSPGLMLTSLTGAWDPRLLETLRASGTPLTDPARAARRIADLIFSETTPGQGEDHVL
jgi:NAD(P)-dependent dehydrogenase (short-subunit alcohol dehydrogenase family)